MIQGWSRPRPGTGFTYGFSSPQRWWPLPPGCARGEALTCASKWSTTPWSGRKGWSPTDRSVNARIPSIRHFPHVRRDRVVVATGMVSWCGSWVRPSIRASPGWAGKKPGSLESQGMRTARTRPPCHGSFRPSLRHACPVVRRPAKMASGLPGRGMAAGSLTSGFGLSFLPGEALIPIFTLVFSLGLCGCVFSEAVGHEVMAPMEPAKTVTRDHGQAGALHFRGWTFSSVCVSSATYQGTGSSSSDLDLAHRIAVHINRVNCHQDHAQSTTPARHAGRNRRPWH